MRKLLVLALVLVLGATPALAYNYTVPSGTVARGNVATILSAVTTGTSTVITTDYKVASQGLDLWWNGTCSGGTVVIEISPGVAFADTWITVMTITAHSDVADQVVLTYPTHSVRARVTSDVTGGGKLTVYFTGVNY